MRAPRCVRGALLARQQRGWAACARVEEDLDARQQDLELPLDDRDGVLTGTPDVAVEEVPRDAHPDAHLGRLVGRDEADRGSLLGVAGREDGADEEEDQRGADEDEHRVDDAGQVIEAEDCISIVDAGALNDSEEDGGPVRGEEEEEEHEASGNS